MTNKIIDSLLEKPAFIKTLGIIGFLLSILTSTLINIFAAFLAFQTYLQTENAFTAFIIFFIGSCIPETWRRYQDHRMNMYSQPQLASIRFTIKEDPADK